MVYLYHFARPLGNPSNPRALAQHYVGTAEDLIARDAAHQVGRGAKLTAAAVAAEIPITIVRIWPGGRDIERWLKRSYKNARELCPCCAGPAAWRRAVVQPRIVQLELELEDLPDVATCARADFYEVATLRRWRTARVLPASGHLDDDLL